jgi:hypothetical protein
MITAKLKNILTASGCTLVLYEQDKLANLQTNQSNQADIIGLIIQPNDLTLEVRANAIHEHYNPLTIEVMQQVRLEDAADNNETKLQLLLNICKEIIIRLIHEAEYKTLMPVTVVKILESKYDANVIGWSMPLDLYYLLNENRDPCL